MTMAWYSVNPERPVNVADVASGPTVTVFPPKLVRTV
jgi:hypothetical protein